MILSRKRRSLARNWSPFCVSCRVLRIWRCGCDYGQRKRLVIVPVADYKLSAPPPEVGPMKYKMQPESSNHNFSYYSPANTSQIPIRNINNNKNAYQKAVAPDNCPYPLLRSIRSMLGAVDDTAVVSRRIFEFLLSKSQLQLLHHLVV